MLARWALRCNHLHADSPKAKPIWGEDALSSEQFGAEADDEPSMSSRTIPGFKRKANKTEREVEIRHEGFRNAANHCNRS